MFHWTIFVCACLFFILKKIILLVHLRWLCASGGMLKSNHTQTHKHTHTHEHASTHTHKYIHATQFVFVRQFYCENGFALTRYSSNCEKRINLEL